MKRSSKLSMDELDRRCREIFEDEDFGEGAESLDVFDDGVIEVEYTYITGKPQFATRYSTKLLHSEDITPKELDYLLGNTDSPDDEDTILESKEKDYKIDAYVIFIPELNAIEGHASFIPLKNNMDKRSPIYIYPTEKQALAKAKKYNGQKFSLIDQKTGLWDSVELHPEVNRVDLTLHIKNNDEFLESLMPWRIYEAADEDSTTLREFTNPYELYNFVKNNDEVVFVYLRQLSNQTDYENNYEFSEIWEKDVDSLDDLIDTLKLDKDKLEDDTILEDLHPEVNLGWIMKGHRHSVDADTFTTKKKGDKITVHISDDLPDLEYNVFDGSYLDDEAVEDSPYHNDTFAEYSPTANSRNNFNDKLTELIRDAVSREIMDTIKPEYKQERAWVNIGGSSGNVPDYLSIQVSNKRRIPAIHHDKDEVIESLEEFDDNILFSQLPKDTQLEIANNVGCGIEDINDTMSNILMHNEETYADVAREHDETEENMRSEEYPLGWVDKNTWEDFRKRTKHWASWLQCLISGGDWEIEFKLVDEKDEFIECKLNEEKSDDIYSFIEDLYNLRKDSIAKEGEYGLGNLVFKEFRNLGYLDNLKDLRRKEKSKELSLEQLDKENI